MPIDGPDVVLYEKKGHVGIITMNRPERMNSLGGGLPQRVQEFWAEVARDDDVWCAILTGVGRAFCAGADLKAAAEREVSGQEGSMIPTEVTSFRHVPTWKPTIAAINGF